jgi:hypothetical protein
VEAREAAEKEAKEAVDKIAKKRGRRKMLR